MLNRDEPKSEADALRDGGVEVLTKFFERDRERLRLFIKHRTDERLLGRLDWDDVLQETFIVIQRRYLDYVGKPSVPLYVWMRAIAGQVLIDLHRKHFGMKKRSIEREVSMHRRLPVQSTSASLGSLLAASGTSPSNAAIRMEQLEQMKKNLDGMSEMDREILVLRHMEQLSNGEVAHVLGIDKSAATKRYMRALKRLRDRITETAKS